MKTVESSEAVKILSYNVHVFEELEPTAVWGKLYKKAVVQNLRFNENMNIGEDFIFNYFANCNSKELYRNKLCSLACLFRRQPASPAKENGK